ncbi:MAG: class I SAM-dependent methyltransferase [Cytophagia bacterium]|nr:MAG: class I SAM-dependent methyltransferase [Runella sp.]TAG20285.1 MAG: class I SAM-dependent methyltransferase [Cytophagales bacterium]TAG39429.1 MAG: class I SAM-dependent methyltransferase [Cytophagia bacterium]TAG80857.1 MAG: class I SAM-dependent methyltransferase [Cytophagales bacterium]
MPTPVNLPPTHDRLAKHAVFPEFDHDETARYNFLTNLNKHLSTVISPGNKVAFDKRVRPQFMAEHGRDFDTPDEVKEAMLQDPHYQTWSALRRSAMEMRQQVGRATVLRQANELAEKVAKLNAQSPDTLTINPDVSAPHYMTMFDSHIMPGSYHTELFPGDVSNAASYDSGLFVTSAGMLGKYTDGGGKALTTWLKATYPDFKPKRILDIGCGLGHNTLPLAMAFPDAEVVGIDTGIPMVRYGHARAVALGVKNVQFMNLDATQTGFENESFDWIQTTMFLHETSTHAMQRLIGEIYRMLKPNGLSLHIEQPQYTPQMSVYEKFIRDWDALYNNEPFWGAMHDVDVRTWMTSAGFEEKNLLQFGAKAENDMEYPKNPNAPEVEDHGRSPIWNVFGAWK